MSIQWSYQFIAECLQVVQENLLLGRRAETTARTKDAKTVCFEL
jgi:hypothetical protein